MALKFYTRVAKGLKLNVRKFWRLLPTFVEVTEEKLIGGLFAPPILNRVKYMTYMQVMKIFSFHFTIPSIFMLIENIA